MPFLLFLVLVLASPAAAQTVAARDSIRDDSRFSFYDRGPYRPAVPKPESILRYGVGEANTQFALQERVLLAIAAAGGALGYAAAIGLRRMRRRRMVAQKRRGGLLLWVSTPTRDREEKATAILSRHGARDVHINETMRQVA